MAEIWDTVVVGCGSHGSAAFFHIAKRGQRVLGLEKFENAGHSSGSGHGESRIIRLAYFEHPNYVPLLHESYALWEQLEKETHKQLFTKTGGIDAGLPDSTLVTGSLLACTTHNLEHQLLTSAQVHAKFPGITLPEGYVAVYQKDAGILAPELCTATHCEMGVKKGGVIRFGESVSTLRKYSGSTSSQKLVEVKTDKGSYICRHVILAAGAWMPEILSSLPLTKHISSLLHVERQVVHWYKPLKPELFQPSTFPIFIVEMHEGKDKPVSNYYGFPTFGKTPGMKCARYDHFKERVHPSHFDRSVINSADLTSTKTLVDTVFPHANGGIIKSSTCMFTNTPDSHFIIDTHPAFDGTVTFISACSGHGYKFSSAIGKALADMAQGIPRPDLKWLSCERLEKQTSKL